MTEPYLLTLNDISVRFGGLTALEGINIRLARGSSLGLLGPNGAGKTTLFNVIAGAVSPSAGHVRFPDHPAVRKLDRARKRNGRPYCSRNADAAG